MAGSFKPILDSTNNIITKNPRVKERFDLPYLLHRDPAHWRADDEGLALCKLMPLDNDTYDVKMPSLEGKAWAGANGDWVVYIGYNCEWELVNLYSRHRVPLPKILDDCPEVEYTGILREFKYDHADGRLQKIAICRVPNRSWGYRNCRGIVTADVLVQGLSRGAIATRKLKGVKRDKGYEDYIGSGPYGEGKSLLQLRWNYLGF